MITAKNPRADHEEPSNRKNSSTFVGLASLAAITGMIRNAVLSIKCYKRKEN